MIYVEPLLARILLLLPTLLLVFIARPSSGLATDSSRASPSISALLKRAQSSIDQRRVDEAFGTLSEIYALDPQARGLNRLFESCLKLRVEDDEYSRNTQDRFGLASLLIDQERYEEALVLLREIIALQPSNEQAASLLFRTNAACCHWDTYEEDARKLVSSLRLKERSNVQNNVNDVPVVHPFEALKWPCISLPEATQIAYLYARRAIGSVTPDYITKIDMDMSNRRRPIVTVARDTKQGLPRRKLRLGYISPDFTSKHPLAFLMQHVFEHHNRTDFSVHLYSLSKPDVDDGPELRHIRNGTDSFTYLPPGASPQELANRIQQDKLDMLVDLCGYAGTMLVAQVMALRPAPLQISYMGFPASSGAPYHDYLVCDTVVVPPFLRQHYSEGIIWMPHCYFVNSHLQCRASDKNVLVTSKEQKWELRQRYQLPQDGFVYCCHSRPDKIDPSIFRTWLRALKRVRTHDSTAVLWLLRSGSEMEANLRRIARTEFDLDEDDESSTLVFADICPRDTHLRRLGAADLFLDTPAYNAHTLGCDTLFAGVPMITLLRPHKDSEETNYNQHEPWVDTEKLASRVGASLLMAAGLEEMVCPTMQDYEDLMVSCATDKKDWYENTVRSRLLQSRTTCPLFDTHRWVENLELALRYIVLRDTDGRRPDIRVQDTAKRRAPER